MKSHLELDKSRLWAKRWINDDGPLGSAYLPEHLHDVYTAAQSILDMTAESQLIALGLYPKEWLACFRRVVSLAAAIHDLGKCNSHFQGMLKNNIHQALRHEWITLLILHDVSIRDWLLPAVKNNENEWRLVCWAVAGHHPRYDRSFPPETGEGPAKMTIPPLDNQDMKAIFKWLCDLFHLGQTPIPLIFTTIDLTIGGNEELEKLYQSYYDDEERYDEMEADFRRLAEVGPTNWTI